MNSMKKIAFYVEGLTEQFFINKLLVEIAGKKNIEIEWDTVPVNRKIIIPKTIPQPSDPLYYALIYDCMGESNVQSKILENYPDLISAGYSEVIGLLDLYPRDRTGLAEFENELINGIRNKKGQLIIKPLPDHASIVIAVNEIESWFLAECSHFQKIDNNLTISKISSNLGFNPCVDDMTLRSHPAKDLHDIYQLVDLAYLDGNGKKRKNRIERTVEHLDYPDIYLNLPKKITKLNDLISKIDAFLT
jgi:hypothetical protein